MIHLVRRMVHTRRRRPTALVADVALGGVFLVVMLAERFQAAETLGGLKPMAVGFSVLIAGGLALRRQAPVLGYLLGSSALVAETLFVAPSPISPYSNLVGIYSVGLYATRSRAWWGPAVALPGVIVYFLRLQPSSLVALTGVLFSWALAWALGYRTARWREQQRATQRLTQRQAVAEERAHIARELHDLVGHTVNLMLVQAGAARMTLDNSPQQTRQLLSSVEDTGRDALAELDRVLGILRHDGPPDRAGERDAEPGLSNIAQLCDQMTRAGMRVEVTGESNLAVPRSLSLTAYRIVQESLTNALTHGQAGRATVAVGLVGRVLAIEITDDGRGSQPERPPGRGLLGMRERATMFGGTVEHGPGDRGGFRVRAELPLP